MSLLSRRSTMVVAGCALVLPLAAGTANAAFDLRGDDAAPVEDTPASVEGSVDSTDATDTTDVTDSTRARACVDELRPCAAMRAPRVPTAIEDQLAQLDGIDAEALGEAAKDGASVNGSITARGEDLSGSADLSTDGGSLEVDTPFGDGSADATLDGTITADDLLGGR
jgi:hypothetical protein